MPLGKKKRDKILLETINKNEKFFNIFKLIQESSIDLNKRTIEIKNITEKKTIKLENNRNIQIFKIISEDCTYKDLLEELKSS